MEENKITEDDIKLFNIIKYSFLGMTFLVCLELLTMFYFLFFNKGA